MRHRSVPAYILRALPLVLALLALAPPAGAQTAQVYEDMARRQLDALRNTAVEHGYAPVRDYHLDRLDGDSRASLFLTLQAGASYLITGVCDQDCSDIDMRVYDAKRVLVASDEEEDDVPVIQVSPKQTGEYRIEVEMYDCSAEPCYYGIGFFRR
jgi:hypothetical protein